MLKSKIKERRFTKRPAWLRNLSFLTGAVIVLFAVVVALFPQLFTSHDPLEVNALAVLQGPSGAHLFGTDNYGRDVFSRVVWGTRIDLLLGVLGTVIPFVVGCILGLLSGYFSGTLDNILMRVIDILMAFPFIVLVIAIMTVLGQGMINVYIALWVVGWISYAKLVRGDVLVLKNAEYIQAVKIAGFKNSRILLRHLLPNVINAAVVFATSDIVLNMLTGASLSFIGLGIQPPTPEWGAIMNEGRGYINIAWWITLFPGLVMAVTGIGFSLLGDGLADFLRTKGR
ncbi:ABC transporter permease [Caproicibacter sp.]|uniref:ABC transporter permease n=1 Tax=Caproicibacter sp. TaxID=2814884 RepID=UPI003989962F